MKQIFYLLPIILLVLILIPSDVSAKSYVDETTRYSEKFFGILSGTYDTKNGMINLSGMYKYGNTNLSDIRIIGQIKFWNFYDSSIPQCFHIFTDDMTMLFDKNKAYAKIMLKGKWCKSNWSNTWQTLRADYIIIDGSTPSSDGMQGKGIIEVLVNMKTGKVLSGKMSGNIILYT